MEIFITRIKTSSARHISSMINPGQCECCENQLYAQLRRSRRLRRFAPTSITTNWSTTKLTIYVLFAIASISTMPGSWAWITGVVNQHWRSRKLHLNGRHHRLYSSSCGRSSSLTMMATDSQQLRLWGNSLVLELPQGRVPSAFSALSSTATTAAATLWGTSALETVLVDVGTSRSCRLDSRRTFSSSSSSSKKDDDSLEKSVVPTGIKPLQGYGLSLCLSEDEKHLFQLLRRVRQETQLTTTLRVAGGWVRDKLLATPEFQAYHKVFEVGASGQRKRLTSKFQKPSPSLGRQGTKILVNQPGTCQPVDIDIALDDMLGREFADHLNEYLLSQGEKTVSVGVVLKNPEKSKHLETATMKVGPFWIDFVNLRAEEYTQDSRIPDLMRIGTAVEDAFRRDLTINALFYNINTGEVEDWTGRGFHDLRRGIIATPLTPLTTLLDDPLRVLRSVRFAARLRFSMDESLVEAAMDNQVRQALSQKVSRERIGGEVDLMLRSPDPVGAVRLLTNLKLAETVFPIASYIEDKSSTSHLVYRGLTLLGVSHDHLEDCVLSTPIWCVKLTSVFGFVENALIKDDEARRLLWYASFLKPFWEQARKQSQENHAKRDGKKSNRSVIMKLLVDDLKRPVRDAEAIEKIIKAADDFSQLLNIGCDVSATMILISDIRVRSEVIGSDQGRLVCSMNGRLVDSATEEDPVWEHAMEFRQLCSKVLQRTGPLWRAALVLAIAEQLMINEDDLEYTIEGDVVDEAQQERRDGVIERFDTFAVALQQIGLIGIWNEEPLLDGDEVRTVLPNLPKGPAFREVMDKQAEWMTSHPGADVKHLKIYLLSTFPDFR